MLFLFCIFQHEGVYLARVIDAGPKKDILYIAFSSAFECPIVFNIAIVARLYFLQKSKMCYSLFFGRSVYGFSKNESGKEILLNKMLRCS